MKIPRPKPIAFLLFAACAAALVFSTTSGAQHVRRSGGTGSGRLVIWRIPGLGNDLIVGVTIDGRRAGNINYGAHFETTLSPGRHVLSVEAFPQPFPRPPYTITINVRPGELYNFTAKGGTTQLILSRS